MTGEMENLVPIGQFSMASRLSLKALRLYDENRVLPPAWVDPDSGYRYYRLCQLRDATTIALLRRAGMPLADIRNFLEDSRLERLDDYERTIVGELAERRGVLRYLRRMLKEEPMFDVETKPVAAQRYVSRTANVYVRDLEGFIVGTITELSSAHAPEGCSFTLYHGPVNADEDGPVEVCVPTAAGDKELPAGEVAFTIATGSECMFPEILGAYDAVARWVKKRGRELDGPPREIYLSDVSADETPEMEIAWPLR